MPSPSRISLLDDDEVELAFVEQGRDVGADAELDLEPHRGVTRGELPERRRQRVEIEILILPLAASTAEKPAPPAEAQAAAPKCLEAVVNTVTGFAICTNPRGAPVEAPPRESLNRPCKPREHDDDPFTVYEHWSGCHE